ncbi:MAG: hypothetical protein QME88_01555 [Actinomycetota bacterium]|nr:hypothetical protein [Actinomycetota bacterium]
MSRRKQLTVVIPSYWGRSSGEPLNEEDAVYDHPTPLDAGGTLARALESVRILRYRDFRVVVLGAATHPDLEAEVEEKLRGIVAPFRRHYPLALLTHRQEREMIRILEDNGMEAHARFVSLRGYSNIRNFCLIAAHLTGAEAAVLFDDDQVYEDPYYLHKVAQNIGEDGGGGPILGIAGYYVNPDGSYRVPPNRDPVLAEWPAAERMNRAFDIIAGGERLKPTPWVFGGNMVIHRGLFMRVAFDPLVTRGEDIDYLVNARFLGHLFLLDNTLWIRHLPPPKTAPLWRRFREDLDRFIYSRAKLRCQVPVEEAARRVEVEELDPYPGRFLRDDLEDLIFRTVVLMALHYLSQGDAKGYEECMRNLLRARSPEWIPDNPFLAYMEWRRGWEGFMHAAGESGELRAVVEGAFDDRG